ncbi:MAG TPA: BatD family protein [Ignavibacteriales bacterium]|nr:BatD family protein [Ignavibacteriales bacterium]
MVRIKITITALMLILMGTYLHAQEITARAGVDRQQYEVGDYINYSISVNTAKDVKVFPPALKDSLKGAEIIETAKPASEEKDGRLTTTFKYTISKYDSGDVRIPPLAVKYSSQGSEKTVLTNGVSFTVTTLKVKGEDIKDVKDPVKIPLDWKLILLWALIILVVLAGAVYLYMYYRKKKLQRQGIIPVVIKEPHEEALDALDSLEEKKLWQSGRIKEYHTEITDIIRTYFEKRFRVPALEITTNELMANLSKVKETENLRQITSDFLNNADLVKFAKYVPMESINEEMMLQARKIVKDTVPQVSPVVASQEEGASNVS